MFVGTGSLALFTLKIVKNEAKRRWRKGFFYFEKKLDKVLTTGIESFIMDWLTEECMWRKAFCDGA